VKYEDVIRASIAEQRVPDGIIAYRKKRWEEVKKTTFCPQTHVRDLKLFIVARF